MTAKERTVIRAVIRALEGADVVTMDALAFSYGLPAHNYKPTKVRAVALLKVLVEAHDAQT